MRRPLLIATVTAAAAVLGAVAPATASAAERGPTSYLNRVAAEAVSPNGKLAFVTGQVQIPGGYAFEYATVAYNTATGERLWVRLYHTRSSNDGANSVAVNPAGTRVFVTGLGGNTYSTVAYSAASGRQLWARRYRNPSGRPSDPSEVAVGPGGTRVFVTGFSENQAGGNSTDFATVAYSAATGRQLWVRRYHDPANEGSYAFSLAVGGGRVFVTGASNIPGFADEYATVAYSAATGKQLWVRRYAGPGPGFSSSPYSVAVSPGGTTVFVSGQTSNDTGTDYATIAYRTATGKQLWVRLYADAAAGYNPGGWVAVSPAGTTVFVAGTSAASQDAIVAYRASTGKQLWTRLYQGGNHAASVAVNPSGTAVFVTGGGGASAGAEDYATVAYSASTGKRLWARQYSGPLGISVATSVAVSRGRTRVIVTGSTDDGGGLSDWATVAYAASTGRQLWARIVSGP